MYLTLSENRRELEKGQTWKCFFFDAGPAYTKKAKGNSKLSEVARTMSLESLFLAVGSAISYRFRRPS